MARFLSPEWFDEVEQEVAPGRADPVAGGTPQLVLEQVVLGTPEGDVRYRVAVWEGRAQIQEAGGSGAGPVDVTFTCDWATATAIAQGGLPTQTTLTEGRLRIKGNVARLAGQAQHLIGLDPVPERIRRRTTY